MISRIRILLACAIALCGLVAASADARASFQDSQEKPPKFTVKPETHAARGFGTDSTRVDSQITLRIPDGQADAVYAYLKQKYVDQDNILADQCPGIHLKGQKMSDVSMFTDEYFDTPSLDLYKTKNSVRHRSRVNTTNPDDRKSGRELVQMKVTPPGKFTLRNELKYEVDDDTTSGDEIHPLIRLISHKLRDNFLKVFADAGIDPYSLRHIFTIHQTRSRGYLNWDSTNIFSFSVDVGSANMLWAKGVFSSVDMGLVEITYTEADEAKRQKMWDIRDAIIADLKSRFPALTQNSDSKYSIVLAQLISQMPWIPATLKSGLSPAEALLFIALCLAAVVFVGMHFIRTRRQHRAHAEFARHEQAA
jgi:hypothetical protein